MPKAYIRNHKYAHKFVHHMERHMGMSVEEYELARHALINTTDRMCIDCKQQFDSHSLGLCQKKHLPRAKSGTTLVVRGRMPLEYCFTICHNCRSKRNRSPMTYLTREQEVV